MKAQQNRTNRAMAAVAVVATVLALAVGTARAATVLGAWESPITVASGTAGAHEGMVVNEATNTVYTVYASGGAVWSRSISMPSGTLGTPVQILAAGSAPSIAIDSAGNLHVAAYNTGTTNLVYAYSNTGGASWSTRTLDATANHGSNTTITVDPGNRVHLGYRGQNGTENNDGVTPFYDLYYTRFNADVTANDPIAGSWDTPQVLVHSSRVGVKAYWGPLGTEMDNVDIEADGSNVWLARREAVDSPSGNGGYLLYRGVTAPASDPFAESSGVWDATMFGQFELRADGTPYRVAWDRAGGTYLQSTPDDGFVGVPYNASGSPVDTDSGLAGYQGYRIDTGVHANWYNVGQRMDLVIDVNGAYHAVYYAGSGTTGLKFATSSDSGVSWTTEFLTGGGSYSGDSRIAYDPLVSGGMGRVYLLSNDGSGTLTLFPRDAHMVPEPATAALLALAGLAALRRGRRA